MWFVCQQSDEIRNAYGQEYFDNKTELMLSYTTAGVSTSNGMFSLSEMTNTTTKFPIGL